MEDTNNYNIHIITKNNDKIQSADNKAEMYLVIQNEELLNQNKQVIIDMKELQREKDEVDEWIDKADKDKQYMKNFIKTLVQQNSLITSIKDNYESIFKIKEFTINCILLLIGLQFLIYFLELPFLVNVLYYISHIFVYVTSYENEEKYNKNTDKYYKELETIEKSNDYLNDYIDNM